MELTSESQRFEEGAIAHDLPAFTPEQIALQALVEQITNKIDQDS